MISTIPIERITIRCRLPSPAQQLSEAVWKHDIDSVHGLITGDYAVTQKGAAGLDCAVVENAITALFEDRSCSEESKAAILKELTGYRGFDRRHIPDFIFKLPLNDAKQAIQSFVESGTAPRMREKSNMSGVSPDVCEFVLQLKNERLAQYAEYRSEKIRKHKLNEERPLAPFFHQKRDAELDLNGRIQGTDKDKKSASYVCRHIDVVMRSKEQDGPQSHKAFKERLDIFSNEESAAKKLNSIGYDTLEKLSKTSAPSVQCSDAEFGKLLYKLSGELKEGSAASYSLCFQSSDTVSHAITLHVHKRNGRIGVGVHDSNVTANMKHVEFLGEDKDRITALKLRHFMAATYDLPLFTFSVIDVSAPFSKKYAGRLVGQDVREKADSIWDALAEDGAEHIREVSASFDGKGISGSKLLFLLGRKTAPAGASVPALFMGLSRGHAEAIYAFGDLLARMPDKMRTEVLADMLAAKGVSGCPGLAAALHNGHGNAVRAFGELLKLIPEKRRPFDLLDLLEARDADGISGLEWALRNQRKDAVLAFTEIVQANAVHLSRNARTALLRTIREAHSDRPWYALCIRINKPHYSELIRDRAFREKFEAMKEVLKH